MCVELLMDPFHPDENGPIAYRAYLGGGYDNGSQAFTIILKHIGSGNFRRLGNKECDLQVTDLDQALSALRIKDWSLRDAFISNPQPQLPAQPFAEKFSVPVILNCSIALRSGVEIGGFWAEHVYAKEVSGEKIYRSVLIALDDRSTTFTVRNVRSGEMGGFILTLKTWETFDVSIVYGLNESEFVEREFFRRLLERSPR
jgi:hypothetical protein